MKAPREDARVVLRDRARIVLWAIGLTTAVQAVGAFLQRNHVGAVVLQLVVTEFGVGRLGVAWSDPKAPEPSASAIARRIARGAAIGASAGVVTLGALVSLHLASIEVDAPSMSTLFVGAVVATFAAARDELLLRGLVLRALGPTVSLPFRLGVTALAGGAAAWGAGASPIGIVAQLALALAFTSLWIVDRGAWIATAAHAVLAILLGPVASGGLIDVRTLSHATLDETPIALVVFAGTAAYAVRLVLRADADATQKAGPKSDRK
ncbi:hypothetical protein BH09MYX1_BH09MYX1_07720 [soil metagenome]